MENAVILEKVERHEEDIKMLKQWRECTIEKNYELRELIISAVAEGNKPIYERLDILEKESGEKAKKELENQKVGRNQFLVSVALIVLTAFISFFSGIILNSMSDAKTVQQKVQEQIQYENSL